MTLALAVRRNPPMTQAAGYHPGGLAAGAAADPPGALRGTDIRASRQVPLQPPVIMTSDPQPVTGYAARFAKLVGTLYKGLPSYPYGPGTARVRLRQPDTQNLGEPVKIAAAAQYVPAKQNPPYWRALDRR